LTWIKPCRFGRCLRWRFGTTTDVPAHAVADACLRRDVSWGRSVDSLRKRCGNRAPAQQRAAQTSSCKPTFGEQPKELIHDDAPRSCSHAGRNWICSIARACSCAAAARVLPAAARSASETISAVLAAAAILAISGIVQCPAVMVMATTTKEPSPRTALIKIKQVRRRIRYGNVRPTRGDTDDGFDGRPEGIGHVLVVSASPLVG
jgi:hypothetical protein